MKIDWNKKYTTIAVYSFIVICLSIIFQNLLNKLDTIRTSLNFIVATLQPFIIGFAIAYLLNFIMSFIEKRIFSIKHLDKINKKTKRGFSILITYIITFFIFYLFGKFVLPQVVDSIKGLVNDIPTYISNFTTIIEDLNKSINIDEQYLHLVLDKWNDLVTYTINTISNLLPVLGDMIKSAVSSIWNVILGVIISIYMLIDKENFSALSKKVLYALLSEKNTHVILGLANKTHDTFGKFIIGKIIDSTIIGILTFVVLTIFKMPYTILVSVIIGITNIIPFFGPFFGAIPSFIIIMFVSPIKAIWFLGIILAIQQIDGNIIGPKILGDSIGISAFWILFSLLIAGKVLGLTGMITGVPLFAIIYSIIKDAIEYKLDKKGMPKDTKDYI